MIRGGLLASVLAACWTGGAPPAPPAAAPRPAAPANQRFPFAEISAIHTCTATGPTALVVRLTSVNETERLELQLAYRQGAAIPATFIEGQNAEISVCAFHGCTASTVTIDALQLGVHARGRYHVEANAGPRYHDVFDAAWVGTPWQVRPCPYDMNPP